MLKTLDVILIGAMMAAAAVTYHVKHLADVRYAEVRALENEILLHENTIDLLEADWALLNQPTRLQRLIEAHVDQLGLEEMKTTQVVTLDELPGFPPPPEIVPGDDAAPLALVEVSPGQPAGLPAVPLPRAAPRAVEQAWNQAAGPMAPAAPSAPSPASDDAIADMITTGAVAQ